MEQTTESPKENLYIHAAKFGGILGLTGIVLTVLFYVVDLSFMATFKFLGLMLVITVGLLIFAGMNYRNLIGGYIDYGKAFLHALIVCAASGLLTTIFSIILYTVIDPELPTVMTETIIANTEAMMAKFNSPADAIEKATDQMRIDLPKQFSAGGLAIGYFKNLIAGVIISLIVGLIVRKNPPVEM